MNSRPSSHGRDSMMHAPTYVVKTLINDRRLNVCVYNAVCQTAVWGGSIAGGICVSL